MYNITVEIRHKGSNSDICVLPLCNIKKIRSQYQNICKYKQGISTTNET